ncbi:Unknown protein sequence [Pseudomonas syringae pv. cilantro]|uniref:Uncharacterized protein n=1 Tax=Pseudomonas syringae pv. cilantro TaxID=81035 RepID=A0A0N0GDF8_PSESX|nr:Unknown protein sequence [Pseudomonas syringae pv. cilantro]
MTPEKPVHYFWHIFIGVDVKQCSCFFQRPYRFQTSIIYLPLKSK